MRKIENSRVIRQLLEEKRQKNIKKILDKSNAPSNKIKTKIDQRINFKFSKSWRNKSIEEKGKSQRNKYQNEFYDLTFY
jgi:3-phosphoglycerate kinase